jgi:hypothetical protein
MKKRYLTILAVSLMLFNVSAVLVQPPLHTNRQIGEQHVLLAESLVWIKDGQLTSLPLTMGSYTVQAQSQPSSKHLFKTSERSFGVWTPGEPLSTFDQWLSPQGQVAIPPAVDRLKETSSGQLLFQSGQDSVFLLVEIAGEPALQEIPLALETDSVLLDIDYHQGLLYVLYSNLDQVCALKLIGGPGTPTVRRLPQSATRILHAGPAGLLLQTKQGELLDVVIDSEGIQVASLQFPAQQKTLEKIPILQVRRVTGFLALETQGTLSVLDRRILKIAEQNPSNSSSLNQNTSRMSDFLYCVWPEPLKIECLTSKKEIDQIHLPETERHPTLGTSISPAKDNRRVLQSGCSSGCECEPAPNQLTCSCLPGFIPVSTAPSPLVCEFPCGNHNSDCSTCDSSECYTCYTNRVASGTNCICLPGTYDDGNSCQSCDPSCNECSGGGPNQCTSCTPPRGLISDGSCPICNSPSYLENGNCIACHISCLTCTWIAPDFCLTCPPGRFRSATLGHCPLNCASNQYYSWSTDSCLACSTSCLTCTGSPDYCTSCPPGSIHSPTSWSLPPAAICMGEAASCDMALHFEGENGECLSCLSAATPFPCSRIFGFAIGFSGFSGWFRSADGYLNQCHLDCGECSDSGNHQCTDCRTSPLVSGRCLPKCNLEGYFPVAGVPTCKVTNPLCRLSDTNGLCVDCADQFLRSTITDNICEPNCRPRELLVGGVCTPSDSKCRKLNTANTGCLSCQLGFFPQAGGCLACYATCRTCTGTGASQCISCYAGFKLEGGSCVKRCEEQEYADAGGLCRPCQGNCLNCDAIDNTFCLACIPGFGLTAGNKCAPLCPVGTFYNAAASACEACAIPCLTCSSSASSCLSCTSNAYSYDEVLMTCSLRICHPSCQTCFGPLASNCITPILEKMLDRSNFAEPSTGKCLLGFYWNSPTGQCSSCHQSCEQCSGPARTDCITCASDKFKWRGICTSNPNNCQLYNGQTLDPVTEDCVACGANCLVCSASDSICEFCQNGHYPALGAPFILGFCIPCSANSVYCSQKAPIMPLLCASGFEYRSGPDRCIPRCRYGLFFDGTTCTSCNTSCGLCTGGTNKRCTFCHPKDFLYRATAVSSDTECLPAVDRSGSFFYDPARLRCSYPFQTCSTAMIPTTCFDGFFQVGNSCDTCHPGCKTCYNLADECTSCWPGFAHEPSTKTCRMICRSFEYFHLAQNRCQLCNPNCKSCSPGPLQQGNACTGCYPGFFISNHLSFPSCRHCHSSCRTCISAASNACLTCPPTHTHDPLTNKCNILPCEPGSYRDQGTGRCIWCHKYCTTCDGPSPLDCLSCMTGYALVSSSDPPVPIATGPARCQRECLTGYYPSSSAPNECLLCDSSCATCTGPGRVSCLTCVTGHYLEGTQCLPCHHWCASCSQESSFKCSSCYPTYQLQPSGYCQKYPLQPAKYIDFALNDYFPCYWTCAECSGPLINECTTCIAGRITRPRDNHCVLNCGERFFYSDQTSSCENCDESCQTCFYGSPYDCETCRAGKLRRLDNTCRTDCLPNNYVNPQGTHCEPCFNRCATCTGPQDTDCDICMPLYFKIKDGSCSTQCPEQTFPVNDRGGFKCVDCHESCGRCKNPEASGCLTCKTPEYMVQRSDGICIDCLDHPEEDEKICNFNVILILLKPSLKSVNQKASLSLRISFRNEVSFLRSLTNEILKGALKPSVQDIADKEFNYDFAVRYGEIILDLFFEGMSPDIKTLRLVPQKRIILRNEVTKKAVLIFRDKAPEYLIYAMKKPNPVLMDRLNSMNSASIVYSKALSYISIILAALVVCSQSGFGAPIMKIFKVFKLLSRLKLVNVFFGSYLEIFLQVAGNLYIIGDDNMDAKAQLYGANTKGKLKLYGVTALSVEKLAIPYAIFIAMMVVRIYTTKVSVYLDSQKKMATFDKVLHFIGDKSRIMLMLTIGIDIIFYSFHCIAHLNIPIWSGTLDSQISLIISMVAVFLVFYDFSEVVSVCSSTKFLHTKIEGSKMLKLRVLFDRKTEDGVGSLDPKEQKRMQEFVGRDITDMSKDAKTILLGQKSIEEFITEDIKIDKLTTFSGRFFNIFGLIKLFLFEPLFVGLQLFPSFQVCCLLGIQLVYLGFVVKAGLKDQIFKSKLTFIEALVNELVIGLFLAVGTFFHTMGSQPGVDPEVWEIMQYVVMVGITLSILIGFTSFVYSAISSLWTSRKEKAFKEFVIEYNKQKELDDLVRIRRYENEETKSELYVSSGDEGNEEEGGNKKRGKRYPSSMIGLMKYTERVRQGKLNSLMIKDDPSKAKPITSRHIENRIYSPKVENRIKVKKVAGQGRDATIGESLPELREHSNMFEALRRKPEMPVPKEHSMMFLALKPQTKRLKAPN